MVPNAFEYTAVALSIININDMIKNLSGLILVQAVNNNKNSTRSVVIKR